MHVKLLLFFVLSSIWLSSCNSELKQKEALLDQREKELIEKEKAFALKEYEYNALLKIRDSLLANKDTMQVDSLPVHFGGKWNSKIVCTESSCNDIVIGDQKTENWELVFDQGSMRIKTYDKNKLIRIYTGSKQNNELVLFYSNEGTTMKIILNELKPGRIKGIREITRSENCKAVYSINLERPL